MTPRRSFLALTLAAALLGTVAPVAASTSHDHGEIASNIDPYSRVFVVTSDSTYRNTLMKVQSALADSRQLATLRDSLGTELVLLETRAGQLPAISHAIHEIQKTCGGYFAFDTREAAEAAIRNDLSKQGMARTITYTIDQQAIVKPWIEQVNAENVKATITHLSTAYNNRYYANATGRQAAQWIHDTWLALGKGRSDVSAQMFTNCSNCGGQPSPILTVKGTDLPDEIVVVGGHLDSISNSGSGTGMYAPGADDDASGIASITEVIRIAMASGWKPKRTVMFMGYAAEEVGLRGSYAIANSFRAQGKNVVGVLQLDMTNYRASNATTDMRVLTDNTNAAQNTFLRNLFATYMPGMTLGSTTCGYGCSDYYSWTKAGYAASMLDEPTKFSYLHTAYDTLAYMGNQATQAAKHTKMALAYIGELAKSGGTVVDNKPPVAAFTVETKLLGASFTDASTDADGKITARAWDFGDGGKSTEVNPFHEYGKDGTYTATLTVTDDKGATHSVSKPVTVKGDTQPDGSLTNGQPVTNLSGAQASERFFTLQVPATATGLRFTTAGGSGDADLYVKFGAAPTTSSYDCRSYGSSSTEVCEMAQVQAGTYHVMLRGFKAFSGVSLTGTYTEGASRQVYANENDMAITDPGTVESVINVTGRSGNAPADSRVQVAIVHPYSGDLVVDLVAPSGKTYSLRPPRSGGSADDVRVTVTVDLSGESLNGAWKLRVQDAARGDAGRIDRWSLTF